MEVGGGRGCRELGLGLGLGQRARLLDALLLIGRIGLLVLAKVVSGYLTLLGTRRLG